MLKLFRQDHPKGLYLLFCVEMWERFSFYGMRALIVLYMIENLMYTTQKAGNIYGLYTGLVYLTPLIGGYLADRYLGQRKCITTGATLMIFGLFLLSFGPKSLFLLSLFLMIIANGFFKSNISSVLGLLYGNNDEKKDSAYTIFYMGINLGAFFSPLICGTLAVKYGYEYGFAAAGMGMLIGLLCYKLFENKLLGDCGLKPVIADKTHSNNEGFKSEKQKSQFISLIILMLFTIPFWICFEQAGSSLTLFAQYLTDRNFFGYEIPTGYFQSLNPLFIIILAPIISVLWGNLRTKQKEPTSVEKFAIALFLISLSYIIMAFAGYLSKTSPVSPLWLIIGYFIMTVAELCLSPIGLSLVSKLAPKKFLSLTMGLWFLTSFLGNLVAGVLGGLYEKLQTEQLFGILFIISFTAFILLLLILPKINKTIK
ncbi:MAG: peptide MFS transporter [Cyanobacteria bacterium SIG26]|nr:peptide MFS transporter [Cyanobacteria bacterium SIG26]